MSSVWDSVLHFSSLLEDYILGFTSSLWIYPSIYLVSVIDGIFPVVPSESIVIASATAAAKNDAPILVFVWLAAAAGAWSGDQSARFIGSKINIHRWGFFKRPRVRKTVQWAEHGLERRGTALILAARFIPGGRVAVNLSAGALGFPLPRFMGITAIAAAIWASWSVALGTFAGSLFGGNLLLSIAVGVAGGTALGYLVDQILTRVGVAAPELEHGEEAPSEEAAGEVAASEIEAGEEAIGEDSNADA